MRTFIAVQLEDEAQRAECIKRAHDEGYENVSAWMRHRLGLPEYPEQRGKASLKSRRMAQPPLFPELAKADETAALRAQLAAIAARLELLEQGGEQKKSA